MTDKIRRRLFPLFAVIVVGLFGTAALAGHHEMYQDEKDHYDCPEVDAEVDVEAEPVDPELMPPIVPVVEVERPLGLNPLVSAEPFGRLAIDLNLHFSQIQDDVTAFITSPIIQARIPVGMFDMGNSGLELGLDLPLLWITPVDDPGNVLQSAFGVGNPYVSTHFVQGRETFSYSLGLGVAIPLASDEGTRGATRAIGYDYAIGNRIGHDMWLWTPDRLSFVLPARIEALADRIVVGADAAVAAMLWTGTGTQDTDYVTQLGAEIGYRVTPLSTLGLRALGHWAPTLDEYDFAFALEPGFRTSLGTAGFMGVRLTIPVTDPFGFAFDPGNNYALSISFGADL